MSMALAEIRDMIAAMGGAGAYEIIEGRVHAVDEKEALIEVEIAEGVVLPDVKLRAVSDSGRAGFVCMPKVGSFIVFAQVRGEADYVLLKTSELDKVIIEIGEVKVVASEGGVELSKGNVSLKTIFSDLAGLLKQFKVTTPSGPSAAVLPDTLLAIEAFEQNFKTLLNA